VTAGLSRNLAWQLSASWPVSLGARIDAHTATA
jgi:hypothetical protein